MSGHGLAAMAPGPGAPAAKGIMALRYSAGEGRRGERSEQLELRRRFIAVVRGGLQRWFEAGKSWLELPAGTADWNVLIPELLPKYI